MNSSPIRWAPLVVLGLTCGLVQVAVGVVLYLSGVYFEPWSLRLMIVLLAVCIAAGNWWYGKHVLGGRTTYGKAWTYCAVLLVPMTVFIVHMARHDPEFIVRRSTVREKERAQQWVQVAGTPLMLAALVIPGLDHRFGWSSVPPAVVVGALAVSLAGYFAVVRVFLENRWAGRTIETYAGQQVISTGPYAIVRHPMYAGASLLYVATPLALGSWWAVLPALAFIPIFVFRIRNEEEVLVRELAGYGEYRTKVRDRLVPFVW